MKVLTYPKEVKAIKKHKCNFCGTIIDIGEIYMKSTYKYDGRGFYECKTHKYCADIAEQLNIYDEDGFVTIDVFRETIHCKYDNLLIEQLSFDKEQPKKISTIIQELRHVKLKDKLWYVIQYYKKINKDV